MTIYYVSGRGVTQKALLLEYQDITCYLHIRCFISSTRDLPQLLNRQYIHYQPIVICKDWYQTIRLVLRLGKGINRCILLLSAYSSSTREYDDIVKPLLGRCLYFRVLLGACTRVSINKGASLYNIIMLGCIANLVLYNLVTKLWQGCDKIGCTMHTTLKARFSQIATVTKGVFPIARLKVNMEEKERSYQPLIQTFKKIYSSGVSLVYYVSNVA